MYKGKIQPFQSRGNAVLMQGRKANFLISTMLGHFLTPVTNQGLLTVSRANASLHHQHPPRDQRLSPVVAAQRSSHNWGQTPATMVTFKGPQTPLFTASVLSCLNPHNSTWQHRKSKSGVKKNTDEFCKSCSGWKLYLC